MVLPPPFLGAVVWWSVFCMCLLPIFLNRLSDMVKNFAPLSTGIATGIPMIFFNGGALCN